MAFQSGIQTINVLAAQQQVASSVVPVDVTGFTFNLAAARRLYFRILGIFTLGATGGFRFLAHSTVAPTTYNASYNIRQETTPSVFGAVQSAEAAFANAAAVAATYQLSCEGFILSAGATTFSFQFAQNTSDVLAITMLPGAVMQLWQF